MLAACDMHPGYNTTAAAEELGLPLLKVQHHYAHILSCMAENDWQASVIGVSFDGTGYGTDGTIWGGEILRADYEGFTRLASVEPFLQVGGDLSAKEGWRIAVSLLKDIYGEAEACRKAEEWNLCTGQEAAVLCKMAERKINTVISTSAGRLFDAVSAILGICQSSTFEGEASTSLQFAAEGYLKKYKEKTGVEPAFMIDGVSPDAADKSMDFDMPLTVSGENPDFDMFTVVGENPAADERHFLLKTSRLIRRMAEGRQAGEDAGYLAWLFHRELAEMIVASCLRIRRKTGIQTVALSGGVYQNLLLLRYSVERLEAEGFHVLTHHLIPPNDGGICLGQAAAAMAYLQREKSR